ncbi:hypothetical protein T4B_982 [Trichinella pseudospiralis]|uniref:Uncharacterized protein n=1 Tax=Trichinella pseudospiralis TaxID=6337 RepID=A0A0V1KAA0_TRIPS|nr:hypothetical protein T4B_982 [Trichinella pseudospiralis]KRZ44137.1 hypothetical protein T4C_8373 [Trichinella pseudospiralis]
MKSLCTLRRTITEHCLLYQEKKLASVALQKQLIQALQFIKANDNLNKIIEVYDKTYLIKD